MASGALDLKPLVSHRYGVDEAGKAYDLLASGAPSLGILLRYPEREVRPRRVSRPHRAAGRSRGRCRGGPPPAAGAAPVVGVIGAATTPGAC